MKCLYPQIRELNGLRFFHRCGQCANCRITRNQEWTARIIMESRLHRESLFVTLTYDDENIRYSKKDNKPTLRKKDLQKYWKRLRKNTGIKFRYFACGEYGPKTYRPHYHAILFGFPIDLHEEIQKAWPFGFTKVDEITMGRASYVAQYTLKKATKPGVFGDDRQPEFATMSRKPGLAYDYAAKIAASLENHGLHLDKTKIGETDKTYTELKGTIRLNGKQFPLDYYMKNRILEIYDLVNPGEKRLKMFDNHHRVMEYYKNLGDPNSQEALEMEILEDLSDAAAHQLIRIYNNGKTL